MKKLMIIFLISMFLITGVAAEKEKPDTVNELVKFVPLHIYIDSGNAELAAYQFELKAAAGQIKIVGVEGGDNEAFKEPGYYDPAALFNDRIIIASFNTGTELPMGLVRVATVHLQVVGNVEPQYLVELIVAANGEGKEIPAGILFEQGEIK
ncbi:MAG: hypothetical protein E4H40_01015 [Candidatus Brocadiia bacterium]|nr:MAG: hypothetical protein E4H40_01015 [Candidatus Brocadiia bacterium]